MEVQTELRFLRYTSSGGQVLRKYQPGRELSQLRPTLISRASHVVPEQRPHKTTERTDRISQLSEWMEKDNATEPELAYWMHKYILMRGCKLWWEMGDMTTPMRELARSQDTIGWRRFTEGYISTKIYERQKFHLQMSSSRLNATDWTKQLISKILQITHSQWVLRNISLHNQTNGYLHHKRVRELSEEIYRLSELDNDDISQESRFLLEMNLGTLMGQHTEIQAYWITAVHFARAAAKRESAMGRRAKRSRQKHLGKISSRV